jgi:hypothetical protein
MSCARWWSSGSWLPRWRCARRIYADTTQHHRPYRPTTTTWRRCPAAAAAAAAAQPFQPYQAGSTANTVCGAGWSGGGGGGGGELRYAGGGGGGSSGGSLSSAQPGKATHVPSALRCSTNAATSRPAQPNSGEGWDGMGPTACAMDYHRHDGNATQGPPQLRDMPTCW